MPHIVEKVQESNGSWVVRVANNDKTSAVFLHFGSDPSKREILDRFKQFEDGEKARGIEKERDKIERDRLQSTISAFHTNQLTDAQTKELLIEILDRISSHKDV